MPSQGREEVPLPEPAARALADTGPHRLVVTMEETTDDAADRRRIGRVCSVLDEFPGDLPVELCFRIRGAESRFARGSVNAGALDQHRRVLDVAEVRERIKLLMLDALGCALFGSELEWSRILMTTLSELDSSTGCGVWGTAKRFSFAYRPGAMKSHTCAMTSGSAITSPAMAAIWM